MAQIAPKSVEMQVNQSKSCLEEVTGEMTKWSTVLRKNGWDVELSNCRQNWPKISQNWPKSAKKWPLIWLKATLCYVKMAEMWNNPIAYEFNRKSIKIELYQPNSRKAEKLASKSGRWFD